MQPSPDNRGVGPVVRRGNQTMDTPVRFCTFIALAVLLAAQAAAPQTLVSGRSIDMAGNAVAGATVELLVKGVSATTGVDGSFELLDLATVLPRASGSGNPSTVRVQSAILRIAAGTEPATIRARLNNLRGQEVRDVFSGAVPAGTSLDLPLFGQASDISAGLYVLEVDINGTVSRHRVMRLGPTRSSSSPVGRSPGLKKPLEAVDTLRITKDDCATRDILVKQYETDVGTIEISCNTPPADATVWVAPGGTAAWPGTQSNPMGSIAAAIRGSGPGDIVAVRGGEKIYTERNETITGVKGSSDKPIRVIGYGTSRPQIDVSIAEFRGGSSAHPSGAWVSEDQSKNIWVSVNGGFDTDYLAGFGPEGDGVPAGQGRLRLLGYASDAAFESTHLSDANLDCYFGPGLRAGAGGKMRIRTSTAKWSEELGHGDFPNTSKNPNELDVVVFRNGIIWTLSNCEYLTVKNIEFLYARQILALLGCKNITFNDCRFEGKADYVRIDGSSSFVTINGCQFFFNNPNYLPWGAWKWSNQIVDYNGRNSIKCETGSHDITVQNCRFCGCLMCCCLYNESFNVRFLHNELRRTDDDNFTAGASSYNIELAYNIIWDHNSWGWGWVGGANSQKNPGKFWVHHNLVVLSSFYEDAADPGGPFDAPRSSSTAFQSQNFRVGHGINEQYCLPWKIYNNTIIADNSRNGNPFTGIEYMDNWNSTGMNSIATCHEVYNNIIVQRSGDEGLLEQVSVNNTTLSDGPNVFDGNMYWRPVPQSHMWARNLKFADGSGSGTYYSLADIKADAALVAESKKWYSPGFENSGVEEDPKFAGAGGDANYGKTWKIGNFNWVDEIEKYVPENPKAVSGYVDLSGRTDLPDSDSPYRGALDPGGDGSELGPQ